jgi:hypothetical protein
MAETDQILSDAVAKLFGAGGLPAYIASDERLKVAVDSARETFQQRASYAATTELLASSIRTISESAEAMRLATETVRNYDSAVLKVGSVKLSYTLGGK